VIAATMTNSQQWPYVIASYGVTLAGIGIYVWRMLAKARRLGKQVPPEDRPWT
jgi:hypothetical protein